MDEFEVKRRTVDEFKKWAMLEEIFWRQKSRELWVKEEDKNTRFFHKMANAHRRMRFLEKLRVNGDLLVGENNIKERVAGAFQLLLYEMGGVEVQYRGAGVYFSVTHRISSPGVCFL